MPTNALEIQRQQPDKIAGEVADSALAVDADNDAQRYPPYNIARTDENRSRITLGVADFTESELSVEVAGSELTIRGVKQALKAEPPERVITRVFERRFHLADHVSALSASVQDDLLHVDLVREAPEARTLQDVGVERSSQLGINPTGDAEKAMLQDTDAILSRLADGIARERKAMDDLLMRLRNRAA